MHMNQNPMTIMEAVLLLRSGDPSKLTNEAAKRLYDALVQNPAIHVLTGDEEAVQRFRAALELRFEPAAGVSDGAEIPKTRPTYRRLAAAAAVLLLIAMGVRQFVTKDKRLDTRTVSPVVMATPAPLPAPVPSVNPAPAPPVNPHAAPAMANTSPVPVVPAPPPAEPLPDNDAPHMEVAGGEARLEPDGEGGYRLTALDGRTHVKLTGSVKNLRLDGINGQAELDASELAAEHIDFRGQVNGTSTVKLNAPGGVVEFHEAVGGATMVEVAAPGGTVTFRQGDARVSGGTQMNITAKSVDFAAGMDGGSKADVILTNKGSLRYASLGGGSRLHYRKASPDDAVPQVVEGEVREGGRLVLE